jgi:flagellar biosynthesis protein FlhG
MTENPRELLEKKLITVASGKGGVGKTWVSVTLAHTLANLGGKILLFDGDLGLANIDIQLGFMPERDLGDVIAGKYTMAEIISTYEDTGNSGGQLDIIAGKSGSGTLGNLARERLMQIRSDLIELAKDYDHIVLDLAAGIDASVNILSFHKGLVLVVLTADPTSLTDAYAFIKLTHMRDPNTNIQILVNNVPSKQEGKKAFEALQKACKGFLKFSPTLAGIIKNDSRVVDSIRAQTPTLNRHPQSDAAEAALELAEKVKLFE